MRGGVEGYLRDLHSIDIGHRGGGEIGKGTDSVDLPYLRRAPLAGYAL